MARNVVDYDVVPFVDADLFNTPIVVLKETNNGGCFLLDVTKADVKGKFYSSTADQEGGIWDQKFNSVYEWAEYEHIGSLQGWWQKDDIHATGLMMSKEKFSEFVKSKDAVKAFKIVNTKPAGLLKIKKLSMLNADELYYAFKANNKSNG